MRKRRAKSVISTEDWIIGVGSTRLWRMQDAKQRMAIFNRHFPSIEPQAITVPKRTTRFKRTDLSCRDWCPSDDSGNVPYASIRGGIVIIHTPLYSIGQVRGMTYATERKKMDHQRGQSAESQGPHTTLRRFATHFELCSRPHQGRTVCTMGRPDGLLDVLRVAKRVNELRRSSRRRPSRVRAKLGTWSASGSPIGTVRGSSLAAKISSPMPR